MTLSLQFVAVLVSVATISIEILFTSLCMLALMIGAMPLFSSFCFSCFLFCFVGILLRSRESSAVTCRMAMKLDLPPSTDTIVIVDWLGVCTCVCVCVYTESCAAPCI